MAEAGGISEVIPLSADPKVSVQDEQAPVMKWVLAVVVAVILSTVGGGIWLLQEALVATPGISTSSSSDVLQWFTTEEFYRALITPALVIGSVWCFLALFGVRRVRFWGGQLVESAAREQEDLADQIRELETRLGLAAAATQFWKSQTQEVTNKSTELETINADLESKLDQLSLSEKSLSKEQRQLSQSKSVLERHVEARTVELSRVKGRYESILNSAGEGICSFDLQGKITFANPAAEAMTGWLDGELLGRTEREVFQDCRDQLGDDSAAHLADEPSRPLPTLWRRKDDTLFHVEVVRTPIEEGGRHMGDVLTFKDITERTEADGRLAEKAAELERSNAELEQFAFVASHDLQEPLRKIQAFGDRLKTRCGDDLPGASKDYLQRMQNAAARMQRLIDGLLMFSRVMTRAQPFVQVDLKKIVGEVLDDLEVSIEKTGASVEVGDLPTIDGDPVQIRQLLQNLISNAIKFQANGNAPKVEVRTRILSAGRGSTGASGKTEFLTRPHMCELVVEDNGIGFDEVYLNRLFVVFQRLHGRAEYDGTGIGLAICRKIATRHGGSITAQSKPGEGARFIVTLPLRQEQTGDVAS